MNKLRQLVKDTRGATLVEYIILVGMVALIAFAGFSAFGTKLLGKINDQAGAINNINGTTH